MNKIASNFKADAELVPSLIQKQATNQGNFLAEAEQDLKEMEKIATQVSTDMNELTSVQDKLTDEGQDSLDQSLANLERKQDPELAQINAATKKEIDSGKQAVDKYR